MLRIIGIEELTLLVEQVEYLRGQPSVIAVPRLGLYELERTWPPELTRR